MASIKGSAAELDSMICVKADRPIGWDFKKPKGSFCKVLAVVEVSFLSPSLSLSLSVSVCVSLSLFLSLFVYLFIPRSVVL
jgi:hypothetical protein